MELVAWLNLSNPTIPPALEGYPLVPASLAHRPLVLHVLRVSCRTQVFAAIVEPVAVNVIGLHSGWRVVHQPVHLHVAVEGVPVSVAFPRGLVQPVVVLWRNLRVTVVGERN